MTESAERRKANECDRAGDHENAIQWLIKAAHNGDDAACSILGYRYLTGDRVPGSPPHAVKLLELASSRNQGDASNQLGILAALGVHMKQDWNLAMNYLVLAARQGFTEAQEQLLLLCSNKKLALQKTGNPDFWVEVARAIDLNFWFTPVNPVILSQSPKIGRVPGLVGKEICQWLIKKSAGRLNRAQVYDSVQQKTITHQTRTNSAAVFDITQTNILFTLVQTKIALSMKVPFQQLEPVNILHYQGGEQIRNHYDFINPDAPQYAEQIARNGDRIITFLIYLNDNYQDGETDFPKIGIKHKGTRGEGLFFVNVTDQGLPNLDTLHAGIPPAAGEKWIITQFIRNKSAF